MNRLHGWLAGLLGQRPSSPPPPPPMSASEPPAPSIPPALSPSARPSRGIAFHHLVTTHGRCLSVADGVLTTSAIRDAAHAVVAILPRALPNTALLILPDPSSFAIPPETRPVMAGAARVLQTDTPGIVRLKYPLGEARFLTAAPAPSGAIGFAGNGGSMEATFTLAPLSETAVTAWITAIAAEIAPVAEDGLRADRLLDRLRTGAVRPDLAQALVQLMPSDELEALAARLLHHPADLRLLGRAMPDDGWVTLHLPALAAWLAGGRPPVPGHRLTSPGEDEAMLLPTGGGGPVTAGLALQGLARRQVRPHRLACVLATARNEGPYLIDWVAYHLSIGFEHIFLYTNDNQDGSGALLAALARHGVITLVDNARTGRIGPQGKAYTHALTMLPQMLDYRWTAILDLDEYLGFDTTLFGGIADVIALQECQAVDAIALCWQVYAALPGERWSDRSSLVRFPRRTIDVDQHVKSLVRSRLFWHAQPHFPTATLDMPFTYRTEEGHLHHHAGVKDRLAAFAEAPTARQAWVNHYLLRTADEALWKWARGRADWLSLDGGDQRAWFLDFVSQKFLSLARPERLVEDGRILSCAAIGHEAMLARLLALPEVAEADARVKTDFALALERNTADFLAMPLASDAPDTLLQFRSLLADTHG